MADEKTRIVIIKSDGRATVYPSGTVDVDSTVETIVRDIKELVNLNGEYELYIKVDPHTRLNETPFEGIAILPADVRPSRSVDLG